MRIKKELPEVDSVEPEKKAEIPEQLPAVEERPKKRGRKPKSVTDKNVKIEDITYAKQTISALFSSIFETLAKRLGEHWRLTADENLILTESGFNLVKVYLPEIDEKRLALLMFAGTLAIIIIPRVIESQNVKGKNVKSDERINEIEEQKINNLNS